MLPNLIPILNMVIANAEAARKSDGILPPPPTKPTVPDSAGDSGNSPAATNEPVILETITEKQAEELKSQIKPIYAKAEAGEIDLEARDSQTEDVVQGFIQQRVHEKVEQTLLDEGAGYLPEAGFNKMVAEVEGRLLMEAMITPDSASTKYIQLLLGDIAKVKTTVHQGMLGERDTRDPKVASLDKSVAESLSADADALGARFSRTPEQRGIRAERDRDLAELDTQLNKLPKLTDQHRRARQVAQSLSDVAVSGREGLRRNPGGTIQQVREGIFEAKARSGGKVRITEEQKGFLEGAEGELSVVEQNFNAEIQKTFFELIMEKNPEANPEQVEAGVTKACTEAGEICAAMQEEDKPALTVEEEAKIYAEQVAKSFEITNEAEIAEMVEAAEPVIQNREEALDEVWLSIQEIVDSVFEQFYQFLLQTLTDAIQQYNNEVKTARIEAEEIEKQEVQRQVVSDQIRQAEVARANESSRLNAEEASRSAQNLNSETRLETGVEVREKQVFAVNRDGRESDYYWRNVHKNRLHRNTEKRVHKRDTDDANKKERPSINPSYGRGREPGSLV